jgi:hypothetical protein
VLSRPNAKTHLQIAELGQILSNFINIVPGGMVVFFPSYSFLNGVIAEWTASGTMEKFKAKKKVEFIAEFVDKIISFAQRFSWSHRRLQMSKACYMIMQPLVLPRYVRHPRGSSYVKLKPNRNLRRTGVRKAAPCSLPLSEQNFRKV